MPEQANPTPYPPALDPEPVPCDHDWETWWFDDGEAFCRKCGAHRKPSQGEKETR